MNNQLKEAIETIESFKPEKQSLFDKLLRLVHLRKGCKGCKL